MVVVVVVVLAMVESGGRGGGSGGEGDVCGGRKWSYLLFIHGRYSLRL